MSSKTDTRTPAERRLEKADRAWQKLNSGVMPAGINQFQLPPDLDKACRIDAISNLLIAKGVITVDEFREARTDRLAEIIEELIRQAEQVKRQASGLVMPGPGQRADLRAPEQPRSRHLHD